jgi:hypothetical protein
VKRQLGFAAACSLAPALFAPLHAATEPGSGDTRLHLEACTKWTERDGSLGFQNECGEPVALVFIQLNGEHRFDRLVKPGEHFDPGVGEKTIKATGWLFTVCPAGFVPTLPFTAENQMLILRGQYECVRR